MEQDSDMRIRYPPVNKVQMFMKTSEKTVDTKQMYCATTFQI